MSDDPRPLLRPPAALRLRDGDLDADTMVGILGAQAERMGPRLAMRRPA